MALFTLHHILSDVIKAANPHVLVEEVYRVIWIKRQQTNSNFTSFTTTEEDGASAQIMFIFIHLILFVSSSIAFIGSLSIVQQVDLVKQQRRILLDTLMIAILLQIIYLYTINLLADTLSISLGESASMTLQTVHTTVLFILFTGLQTALNIIKPIGDCLTLNYCNQKPKEKSLISPHFLASILLWGALGSICASLLICEVVAINSHLKIIFTNCTLALSIIAMAFELIIIRLNKLGVLSEEEMVDTTLSTMEVRHNRAILEPKPTKGSFSRKNSLPVEILSISAATSNSGEIVRAIDEDEWNQSDILNWFSIQQYQKQAAYTHPYDKSKFSLYEDFNLENCNQNIKARAVLVEEQVASYFQEVPKVKINSSRNIKSILNTLLAFGDNISLHQQLIMLASIGVIFQANQQCFLNNYLHYLVQMSAIMESSNYRDSPESNWICIFCACILAQNAAKICSLHSISYLTSRWGLNRSLLYLTILAFTYPLHIGLNFKLVENSNGMKSQIFFIIIIGQLLLIQVLIGFIGASVEILMNEMTIEYAQSIDELRLLWLRSGKISKQATLHALINGSFSNIGTALMAALALVVQNFAFVSSNYSKSIIGLISCLPTMLLLALSLIFCLDLVKGGNIVKSKLQVKAGNQTA